MLPASLFLRRLSIFAVSIAALVFGAAFSPLHADNTWDGGGGNGNWNKPSNWGLDTLPSTGVALTFSGNLQTVTNNDLTAGLIYAGISFTNDGTSGKTNAFTLAGNSINPGPGSRIETTASSSLITDTISLSMTLTGNVAVETGSLHNLIISGAILNGSGQRQFAKTGLGELFLTNAGNTYGGATAFNNGTLTVDVAGGIANQGVNSALGNQSTAANAQLNFNGGTLNIKSGAASTDRQVRIGSTVAGAGGGATITNNSINGSTPLIFTNAAFNNISETTSVTAARTLTLGGANTDANAINGIISDNNTAGGGIVSVIKADAGKWILSGANTYTGTTTVSAGTLIVNGHQTVATGVVSVASLATLGGDGTIGGDTTITGNLRVGSDTAVGTTGSLEFVSGKDLSFANGSTWFIDIVGDNFDSISGIDVLAIDAGANLNFTFSGTQTQSTYTLASYGSRTGTFNGFIDGASVGSGYQINYGPTTITLTAVPEPSTVIILGLLLTGALWYGRLRMVRTLEFS